MNTNDLKIFEAVVGNASFTKAAEEMFTVQSNVTARIKSLEEELKINLFTRTSRKVELTEAGRAFLSYSRRINQLVDDAKEELTSSTQLTGILRIGCIETTMALKVPEIINIFTDRYPGVTLNFTSNDSQKLLTDLIDYKLDAAFVAAPVVVPELTTRLIKEETLVIVVPKNYRDIKDLETQPIKIIVFDQGCSYRSRLEVWLKNRGINNYQCIVLNTLEGIINFVEAGLGITILPDELIDKLYYNRKLKTYAVDGDLGKLTTVIAYRSDLMLSKAAKVFLEMF